MTRSPQRSRSLRPPAALACVLALLTLAGGLSVFGTPLACAADEPVDLLGTWYVLVHYSDSDTAHPDAYRWDDRIWLIERKGSRIQWTEYPIVVFTEQEGRFERDKSGTRTRVLHAWEPNGAQRKQIHRGLQVNPRGMKRKTLRLKEGTYRSMSSTAGLSASQVTYQEDWSIADPKGKPIFTRVDSLGSAATETMDGVTRYSVREVLSGGKELRGRFERDLSRRGSFRMMRAGEIGNVPKRKKREPRGGFPDELGALGRDRAAPVEGPLTAEEQRDLDRFEQRALEIEDALADPAPSASPALELPERFASPLPSPQVTAPDSARAPE